ncbi:hypothetical protein acdb102_38130 [Acidothermaceae bacterium B102]|nr:hypothetical protein acdb102_38130 [Acidothermaceae bacterium B102]
MIFTPAHASGLAPSPDRSWLQLRRYSSRQRLLRGGHLTVRRYGLPAGQMAAVGPVCAEPPRHVASWSGEWSGQGAIGVADCRSRVERPVGALRWFWDKSGLILLGLVIIRGVSPQQFVQVRRRRGCPVSRGASELGVRAMVGATDRPDEAARPRRTLAAVAKKAVAGVTASVAPAATKTAATKTAATKTAAPAKTAVKAAPTKAAATKTAPVKATAKAAPAKTAEATAPAKAPVKAAPAKAAPAKTAAVKTAPARPSSRRAKGPFELPPVRDGEEPWTAEELSELRVELDSQAHELRGEIDEAEIAWHDLQRDSGEGSGDDQADAGTKTFEREHELSLANNSRDLLAQVDRALSRLDNGTYGVCENCGQPVGKARLQAFPRATLCVTCKQREERR